MREPGFQSRASIKEQQERIEKHGTPARRLAAAPLLVFVCVMAFLVWIVLMVSGQLGTN